ncbi:MAG: hypothetical protein IPJ21_00740 [Sterolibacteriaceae bacterium]|nr:hypothetical protein [Sterolibacteriaceae bacterium]MBK9086189.1 hypothetical protein [Sterolibacteriaceae bacterium]
MHPTALSRSYAYDLSGNRTLLGIGAASYAATYATSAPLSNRLLATQGPLPARRYSYNEVGAITGDGQQSYAYNLRGRLATLTTSAGASTYAHNNLGQRVAKTVQGTTTRYFYDQAGHLLGEYDGSGWLRPVAAERESGRAGGAQLQSQDAGPVRRCGVGALLQPLSGL